MVATLLMAVASFASFASTNVDDVFVLMVLFDGSVTAST